MSDARLRHREQDAYPDRATPQRFSLDVDLLADDDPGHREPNIDLNLDFEAELLADKPDREPPGVSDPPEPPPVADPERVAADTLVADARRPVGQQLGEPPPDNADQVELGLLPAPAFPVDAEATSAGPRDTEAALELPPSLAEPPAGVGVGPLLPYSGEALPAAAGDALAPAADAPEAALVAHLRERGKLTDGDLARARKLAADDGVPMRTMLVRLGLVSERDMAAAYVAVLDLALVGAEGYPATPVADEHLSLRFLKDARVVPLREDADELQLAVADPLDGAAVRLVEEAAGRPARVRVGLPSEIDAALERLYEAPEPEEADTDLDADLGNFSEEDIEHLRDLASEAPIIRLVNQIMQRAVESRASDVHIEPFADELKVRYRIDGILREYDSPPVRSTAAVISRIKIMAKLNIAERRLPQDGRIPLRIQGKELDLRVSTVPTMFGESVVMRLLDKESVSFDFDALGFDGPPRERVLQILEQPYGIFLVTGPTGSGKSTTLYTALSRLNTGDRKIITVEDPVEYQVPGINQIPVKASIGMTFAHALRAIVRQDPDIIMVGEMRDLETARIAVQSALTGHVVLSTLHTNDAASGVTRLLDMGVEDYLLTSTINGILAQRLVRRLCPNCREPFRPRPEMAARFLQLPGVDENDLTLYHPRGCPACNGTGYRGRLVIAEVLLMTDRVRQAVLKHATATEIGRIAVEQDMLSMYQDGLRKAAAGHTTVEEVLRVAAVSDD
jgi:general secretion pathway protein E